MGTVSKGVYFYHPILVRWVIFSELCFTPTSHDIYMPSAAFHGRLATLIWHQGIFSEGHMNSDSDIWYRSMTIIHEVVYDSCSYFVTGKPLGYVQSRDMDRNEEDG